MGKHKLIWMVFLLLIRYTNFFYFDERHVCTVVLEKLTITACFQLQACSSVLIWFKAEQVFPSGPWTQRSIKFSDSVLVSCLFHLWVHSPRTHPSSVAAEDFVSVAVSISVVRILTLSCFTNSLPILLKFDFNFYTFCPPLQSEEGD